MVGVGFDAVEEVVVCGVEQVSGGRHVICAVPESLATSQQGDLRVINDSYELCKFADDTYLITSASRQC